MKDMHIFNRVLVGLQKHNPELLKTDLANIIGKGKSWLQGDFDLAEGPFFQNHKEYIPELSKLEKYIISQISQLTDIPYTSGVIAELKDLLADIKSVKNVQKAKNLLKDTGYVIVKDTDKPETPVKPKVRIQSTVGRVNRQQQSIDTFGVTYKKIMQVEGKKSERALHEKYDRAVARGEDPVTILKYPVEHYQNA